MALGKKAVVFTLMAIVIAAVIVATAGFFTPQQTVHEDVTLLRVTIVDNLVRTFIQYSEQSLRITTRAALDNLTEILAMQDDDTMTLYYQDMDELMENIDHCLRGDQGNIHVSGDSVGNACIEDFTLVDRTDIFVDLVEETYNVRIDYEIAEESFFINQTQPFEARTNITFSYINISDPATTANWFMQDFQISIRLPLIGLQDPVTTKFARSNNYTKNGFAPYNFDQVTRPNNNVTYMVEIIEEGGFMRFTGAPSILGRYIGDFSPSSDFGIEAFINNSQLDNNDGLWPGNLTTPTPDYSFIDWHVLISNSSEQTAFTPRTFDCSANGNLFALNMSGGETTEAFFWIDSQALVENRYNISSNQRINC